MPVRSLSAESQSPAVETFLLGQVPYLRCLELQRRLVRQVAERDDGQVVVLLCEHSEVITIGRGGRRSQVSSESARIRSGQIGVHMVNRGGGCLLHCPGQLAIYLILPLRWHNFLLGEFLDRFQAALSATVAEFGVQVGQAVPDKVTGKATCQAQPDLRYGIWGRVGQVAAFGVAVRDGVTYHGAYLNVAPPLGLFRLIQSGGPVSNLAAERCGVMRMATVRAVLVRHLTEALGCDRYHLYTGHPWL